MSSFTIALQLGTARLRGGGLLVALAMGVIFALLVGALEHQAGDGAADRALTGVAFGLVLPLAAWGVTGRVCQRDQLQASVRGVARHGGQRQLLCLGLITSSMGWCAVLGTILGGATVVAARGPTDPNLGWDVWASISVGALAGAAYACWFGCASTLGQHGQARTAFLVVDWALGSSASGFAVLVPRGHILNLLGAAAPLSLSQFASAISLLVLIFFLLPLAISRIPR